MTTKMHLSYKLTMQAIATNGDYRATLELFQSHNETPSYSDLIMTIALCSSEITEQNKTWTTPAITPITHLSRWIRSFPYETKHSAWNMLKYSIDACYNHHNALFKFQTAAKILERYAKTNSEFEISAKYAYDDLATWLEILERWHALQISQSPDCQYISTGNRGTYKPTFDQIR